MEVILGDNPFFGVNHRSQVKATEYLEGKGDFTSASEVIRCAHDLDVRKMMLSNHADVCDLLEKVRCDDLNVSGSMEIALVIPYAQKFNQIVGSQGVLGILRNLPIIRSFRSGLALLFSALIFRKPNLEGFIDILIDSELENISGFEDRVKSLCLHNIVADLCLGLGFVDIVNQFCVVAMRKGYESVVITQNPLAFDKVLHPDVTLCFSYNTNGFMVNPSLKKVREELLFERKYWAMAILASGAVTLDEALGDPFLRRFPSVLYATGNCRRARTCIPKLSTALI